MRTCRCMCRFGCASRLVYVCVCVGAGCGVGACYCVCVWGWVTGCARVCVC